MESELKQYYDVEGVTHFRVAEATARPEDIPKIKQALADLCLTHTYLEDATFLESIPKAPVAPSVLIDMFPDGKGGYVSAVTKDKVVEFLESEGSTTRTAKAQATLFDSKVGSHARLLHYAPGSKLNYYGNPCGPGCGCPLKVALGYGWENPTELVTLGLSPISIIAFSNLDSGKIKEYMSYSPDELPVKGFGDRTIDLIRRVGQKLKADLEAANI